MEQHIKDLVQTYLENLCPNFAYKVLLTEFDIKLLSFCTF